MYDELTGNLRAQATHFSVHDETSLLLLKAADAIEDLDNKLNLHRQGKISHWIPVTERLPKLNTDVLITDGIDVGCGYLNSVTSTATSVYPDWHSPFWDICIDHVSHWMPLPEQPEEREA